MEQEESEGKSGSNLVAKSRWKLLAKVLQDANNKQNVGVDVRSELSTTTSRELYGLFEWILLSERCVANKSDGQENNNQWFKCRAFGQPTFSLNVKFSANHFSINELTGFNNTGNVCIWPSEEVLALYCLKHSDLFSDKRVIEIGGGMTCLASFVVAKSSNARTVLATDGNKNSVQNVNSIIQHNNLDGACSVTAQLLDWKNECQDMDSMWDVVLCADCLFFDDGREALVAFMSTITAKNALIIIVAPRRGRTLALFLDLVQRDGKFDIEVFDEEFDFDVTLSHKKKLQNPNYNPDHNYPLLIHLRKLSQT